MVFEYCIVSFAKSLVYGFARNFTVSNAKSLVYGFPQYLHSELCLKFDISHYSTVFHNISTVSNTKRLVHGFCSIV